MSLGLSLDPLMSNDVEARRISDADRDSKSLRERSKFVRSRKAMNEPRHSFAEADLHQNGRVLPRANHGGICERFDFDNHLGSRTEFCGSNEYPFKQSNHQSNRIVAVTNIEKLPTFNGYSLKLDFLDWFDMFEDYFGAVNPPDVFMCKLVASKLKGEAHIWWNELQNNRFSQGKSSITSWSRMRELLLKKFLHTSRLTWWYKAENETSAKPVTCSTKVHNQMNNGCEDETIKYLQVVKTMPSNCLMKWPLEAYNSSQSGNCEHSEHKSGHGLCHPTPVKGTEGLTEASTVADSILKQTEENADDEKHNNCLMICPSGYYHCLLEEKHTTEEARGTSDGNEVVASKESVTIEQSKESFVAEDPKTDICTLINCSIELPFEPDINKHDEENEPRSLGVSRPNFEDTVNIENSEKSESWKLTVGGNTTHFQPEGSSQSKVKEILVKEVLGAAHGICEEHIGELQTGMYQLSPPGIMAVDDCGQIMGAMLRICQVLISNLFLSYGIITAGMLSFIFDPGGKCRSDTYRLNTRSVDRDHFHIYNYLRAHLEIKPPVLAISTFYIGMVLQVLLSRKSRGTILRIGVLTELSDVRTLRGNRKLNCIVLNEVLEVHVAKLKDQMKQELGNAFQGSELLICYVMTTWESNITHLTVDVNPSSGQGMSGVVIIMQYDRWDMLGTKMERFALKLCFKHTYCSCVAIPMNRSLTTGVDAYLTPFLKRYLYSLLANQHDGLVCFRMVNLLKSRAMFSVRILNGYSLSCSVETKATRLYFSLWYTCRVRVWFTKIVVMIFLRSLNEFSAYRTQLNMVLLLPLSHTSGSNKLVELTHITFADPFLVTIDKDLTDVFHNVFVCTWNLIRVIYEYCIQSLFIVENMYYGKVSVDGSSNVLTLFDIGTRDHMVFISVIVVIGMEADITLQTFSIYCKSCIGFRDSATILEFLMLQMHVMHTVYTFDPGGCPYLHRSCGLYMLFSHGADFTIDLNEDLNPFCAVYTPFLHETYGQEMCGSTLWWLFTRFILGVVISSSVENIAHRNGSDVSMKRLRNAVEIAPPGETNLSIMIMLVNDKSEEGSMCCCFLGKQVYDALIKLANEAFSMYWCLGIDVENVQYLKGDGWEEMVSPLCGKRTEIGHWSLLSRAYEFEHLVTERASKSFDTNPSCALEWRIKIYSEMFRPAWQCNIRMGIGLNLTRGRTFPLEGWNDVKDYNAEEWFIVMSLCKKDRFRPTSKMFHKVVNGLDPPTYMKVSGMTSAWILLKVRSWTSFSKQGDGMM